MRTQPPILGRDPDDTEHVAPREFARGSLTSMAEIQIDFSQDDDEESELAEVDS